MSRRVLLLSKHLLVLLPFMELQGLWQVGHGAAALPRQPDAGPRPVPQVLCWRVHHECVLSLCPYVCAYLAVAGRPCRRSAAKNNSWDAEGELKKLSCAPRHHRRRGDGTLAYFFTPEGLSALAAGAGLETEECRYACTALRNRKTGAPDMLRVFVHGVFRKPPL